MAAPAFDRTVPVQSADLTRGAQDSVRTSTLSQQGMLGSSRPTYADLRSLPNIRPARVVSSGVISHTQSLRSNSLRFARFLQLFPEDA